jgi:hypothetical protein
MKLEDLPPLKGPPYKNASGRWWTKGLFWDMMISVRSEERHDFKPVFTLHHEKPGYICFRTSFVELEDPTGYDWAMKYLGDYAHWEDLLKSSWFRDALQTAQEELSQRLKAQALRRVREIAGSDSASSLVASKYLAERGWEKRAGRPSKEQVDKELKKNLEVLDAEADDLARIGGLKVIKGGKK